MTHVAVVDLGFGDAGKGSIVDYLCSPAHSDPAHAVIRFNGGAQAGHNVVTPDGRHHCFSQFGAGTFHGARTFLSRHVLVDPAALAAEAEHLAKTGVPDPLSLLVVDEDALVVTPYHVAANRGREAARDGNRHGSCGMGIGETVAHALQYPDDALRVRDCRTLSPLDLGLKLKRIRDQLAYTGRWWAIANPPSLHATTEAFRAFADAVQCTRFGADYLHTLVTTGPCVFEGAQGVLLDETHGFAPHHTWSDCTFGNAEALLAEVGETAMRLGVTRPYMIRHGPGPLPTEDPTLTFPEPHNTTGPWQGPVRYGHLDTVLLRYALRATGPIDGLALTHLDTAPTQPRICTRYDMPAGTPWPTARRIGLPGVPVGDLAKFLETVRPRIIQPTGTWPEVLEWNTGVPTVIESHGPTYLDKKETP